MSSVFVVVIFVHYPKVEHLKKKLKSYFSSAESPQSPLPSPGLTADDCHRPMTSESPPDEMRTTRKGSTGQKDASTRFHAFKRKFSTNKFKSQEDVVIPQNYNEITCAKCKQVSYGISCRSVSSLSFFTW